jgi:hypothetical protein
MPLRHHPEDEELFEAVLRTGGDPQQLARLGSDAARAIRRRRIRIRLGVSLLGVATGGVLIFLLAN